MMIKKRIVIKLGGSSLQNADTILQLATLIRGYQKRRYQVVLVHGGGPAINSELVRQGIEWQFINGQRQTTPQMMNVVNQVLAFEVNTALVNNLRGAHVAAVGLSAADAKILFCSQADPELMRVGKVESVSVSVIENILMQFGAKVPVIAPIGYGTQDEKYNVNADWAATQIAIALSANKLIFLTDQNGILDGKKQLVARLNSQMIDKMITEGIIHGGMFTKVKAMMSAVSSGIKRVHVLHASHASLALRAEHIGTLLTGVRSTDSTRGVMHECAS